MKLKNLNFLKTVVLLGMFVFFGFVSVISAEDISFENSNDGIQLNQDGNTFFFMTSASVSIKKINFDEATRRLNVQVDLKNNTTNFLDDLEYTIEIYFFDRHTGTRHKRDSVSVLIKLNTVVTILKGNIFGRNYRNKTKENKHPQKNDCLQKIKIF